MNDEPQAGAPSPQVGAGIDQASLPPPQKPQPGSGASSPPDDLTALPTWAQDLIRDLRAENAQHRKAKQQAEQAAQAAATAAAKEQGRWRELAEQYEPKAKRAEQLEQFIHQLLEKELQGLPERLRTLVPAFDDPLQRLQWVQAARQAGVLAPPAPPQTDADRRSAPPGALSEERRRELAAIYGVNPEFLR
ncbi:MAG: hypothetical protein N2383_03385 [Caldilineales bacterium]|nr:hypothetical protein [Caldilineales bacterium]